MVTIGTPKSATATKVLLCGSGELGKEFVIELQRYGVEVIALDKYADAPATQVAHRSYVVSMLDGDALREIVEKEKPDYIVPEVEAIATQTLMELEKEGFHVIPTARATWLTMNREGIRRLAAEELGLPTSPYRFAETEEEFIEAVKVIGMPCVVKPIMSSSGHGQSIIRKEEDIDRSWHYAQEGGRAGAGKVIVEGFVDFDYEITQLTVRHIGGIFAENAWYFRNALVRANYTNLQKGIHETTEYLEAFLRNLLLNEKNELHNRNLHISGLLNEEKVDIGDTKVDIENGKVDIQDKKVDIDSVLSEKGSDFSVKTTIHIHRLFEKFGFDEVFGRSAVMELLELKGSGASKLLSNLVKADIIEPVSGHGKGKYKFKK